MAEYNKGFASKNQTSNSQCFWKRVAKRRKREEMGRISRRINRSK